ncbi:MAG: hypothetical protein AAGF12_40110, partial [Myxococcota bacterium]
MTDPLSKATAAFRALDEDGTEEPHGAATRARVIRTLRRRRQRRTAGGVCFALFLVFSGSTAWAWTTGRLAKLLPFTALASGSTEPEGESGVPRRGPRVALPEPEPTVEAAVEEAAVEEAAVEEAAVEEAA